MRKSLALALLLGLPACSFDLRRSPAGEQRLDATARELGPDLPRSDGPRLDRPPVDVRTGDGPQHPKPSSTICSVDGWCWENPLPQGGTLQAVAVREGTSEAWAVGEGGVVLRSQNGGTKWEGWGAAGGVSKTLRGVWAAPAPSQLVVAVGDEGTILRYDGSAWTFFQWPAKQSLNAVFGTTGSNIVAVGDAGTILRYNGSTWLAESSNTGVALRGVWGAGDVFLAVGDQVGTQGQPAILKREAGQWKPKKSSIGALHAVWSEDAQTIYVAGRGELKSEVFKSADGGESWTAMNPPTGPTFLGIWGQAGDLFAAGEDGKIYHYTGGTWSSKELTVNSTNALKAVTGFSSASSLMGTVIAVGDGGVIARFDPKNNAWAEASLAATRADLYGVWGTADGAAVYAVGETSTGGEVVSRAASASPPWKQLQTFASGLRDVWGTSSGKHVYVVGKKGSIGRYEQGAANPWTNESSPTANDLSAVSGLVDGSEVWAVGGAGTVVQRTTSSTWKAVPLGLSQALMGVLAAGSGEALATDGTAKLLRLKSEPSSTTEDVPSALYGLWGTPELYGVGTGIAHKENIWKSEPNPVGPLHRVWGDGAIVVAVGEKGSALSGIALRHATGGWSAQSAGTSATLRGVWGTKLPSGKSLFYAVGPAGAILRREQP
jgi:photosystem II stability/assembly factor-like uncharacterized protein